MLTAAWLFLKGVPLWVWAVIALVVAGWLYGQARFDAGQADTQADWDADKAKVALQIEALKKKQVVVTTKVETVYVDRVRTIREKGDVIEKVREVFVPVDSGNLPGAFRLFYDGAITGTVPDPAGIPHAIPVPIADVADTHATNAERCRIAYATVDGLQTWITEQGKLP